MPTFTKYAIKVKGKDSYLSNGGFVEGKLDDLEHIDKFDSEKAAISHFWTICHRTTKFSRYVVAKIQYTIRSTSEEIEPSAQDIEKLKKRLFSNHDYGSKLTCLIYSKDGDAYEGFFHIKKEDIAKRKKVSTWSINMRSLATEIRKILKENKIKGYRVIEDYSTVSVVFKSKENAVLAKLCSDELREFIETKDIK